MKNLMPSLFVSHGLPPMAIMDDPYNTALINFGRFLQSELKGIICVSSQWVSPGPIQVTSNVSPSIQYNFQGYQKDIYDLKYAPPFSENLLNLVTSALDKESFEYVLNEHYEFDYGTWMPLRLIRPEADLPVIQLSLPMYEDPRVVLKLGHALSALREEGYLLMGSGAAALNPGKIVWHARGEDVNPKIEEFVNWLKTNLQSANIESLLDYRNSAPNSGFAHLTTATLLPLFFTIGASLSGDKPELIYDGYKYSSSSLLTFCLTQMKIDRGVWS